jgi:hypothetical protein
MALSRGTTGDALLDVCDDEGIVEKEASSKSARLRMRRRVSPRKEHCCRCRGVDRAKVGGDELRSTSS